MGVLPIVLLVAAVVTRVLFLTEITSNTATAATFIAVLGVVALGIGVDSLTLLIPATCAFMLPVGTIRQMARGGLVLKVGVVLITGLFCWVAGRWA